MYYIKYIFYTIKLCKHIYLLFKFDKSNFMENINKKTIYKVIKDISLSYIDIIPSIFSLVIYYYFLLVKLFIN